MINAYLLTMEEVERLIISLDKYYAVSFTNLDKYSRTNVYYCYEVSRKMLRLLRKTALFHNLNDDLAKFLHSNEEGLTRFGKYWDVLFSDGTFPSYKLVDYKVKVAAYNATEGRDIKFGHGLDRSKSWGYVLRDYIADGSLFDKRDEGAAIRHRYERHVYEMLLDYIYFCLMNSERVVSRDMDYKGIEVVDGFDISIAKMFLGYYDKMFGNSVKLVSGKDEVKCRFELFKDGISDYCRIGRGHLVEEYVRHFYFQKEFVEANWYGIQEMLKLDGSVGANEEKFLRNLFFSNTNKASEDKRGRVLATIVRFVDYVLSGCYI